MRLNEQNKRLLIFTIAISLQSLKKNTLKFLGVFGSLSHGYDLE